MGTFLISTYEDQMNKTINNELSHYDYGNE